jgi:hypothetical protein
MYCDPNWGKLYGLGYVGPLPAQIIETLISHGANELLVSSVTLHVGGSCGASSVAETLGSDITFCSGFQHEFNPYQPNGYLIHELIHVRQFRDEGVVNMEVQVILTRIWDWLQDKSGNPGWNPYEEFWVEKEASACHRAYNANSGISLSAAPWLIW